MLREQGEATLRSANWGIAILQFPVFSPGTDNMNRATFSITNHKNSTHYICREDPKPPPDPSVSKRNRTRMSSAIPHLPPGSDRDRSEYFPIFSRPHRSLHLLQLA